MKKIFYTFIGYTLLVPKSFAGDSGILKGLGEGESAVEKIRNGNITTDDIPMIIMGATNYLMAIAGTIAIIFIIIGAYKIAIGSATENSTAEGKKTIMFALGGFILASISWIIFKIIIDNFT